MKPSIGRIVHYTSYGTPGGEYPSVCRAAIVTAVHNDDVVDLFVMNPEGIFLNKGVALSQNNGPYGPYKRGGTWHWPEMVEE